MPYIIVINQYNLRKYKVSFFRFSEARFIQDSVRTLSSSLCRSSRLEIQISKLLFSSEHFKKFIISRQTHGDVSCFQRRPNQTSLFFGSVWFQFLHNGGDVLHFRQWCLFVPPAVDLGLLCGGAFVGPGFVKFPPPPDPEYKQAGTETRQK